MKALVYTGPRAMKLGDRPIPEPMADEVLVRVDSAGICGSDMHAYLGHDDRRPAPLILGHEAAGVIECGPRAGERVTVNPLVTCGDCPACKSARENICPNRQIISMPPREGAFAEMISIPERNLVTVPDTVPLGTAALTEPLAVSWHAARVGLAALHPAMRRDALVIGGGAIGLAAVLALRAMGVERVTLSESGDLRRRYLSERTDVATVADPDGTFALVVDAVGHAATRAIASARTAPGGVILHIGLGDASGGLDIRRMTLQEITFIGTYTYTARDFQDTAAAISDGRLGPLDWIETRSLEAGPQAFADIRAGRVPAPKIILKPA